mgnify:CR=1 FL=1
MTSSLNTTEHNSNRANVSASTIYVDLVKDLTLSHSFNVDENGYVTLYLPEGLEYNRNRPALVCQYDQDCENTTTAYCIDCIQLLDSSNYIYKYKPICRLCPEDEIAVCLDCEREREETRNRQSSGEEFSSDEESTASDVDGDSTHS